MLDQLVNDAAVAPSIRIEQVLQPQNQERPRLSGDYQLASDGNNVWSTGFVDFITAMTR